MVQPRFCVLTMRNRAQSSGRQNDKPLKNGCSHVQITDLDNSVVKKKGKREGGKKTII